MDLTGEFGIVTFHRKSGLRREPQIPIGDAISYSDLPIVTGKGEQMRSR